MMYKVIAVNREFEEERNKKVYEYDYLYGYAMRYKDNIEKEVKDIYIKDDLESRFNVSLEEFRAKCDEAWKDYEITFDERYDNECILIQDEDDEDEEVW